MEKNLLAGHVFVEHHVFSAAGQLFQRRPALSQLIVGGESRSKLARNA